MLEIKGKYNTAYVYAKTVDEETISQLIELCNQEWAKESKIAIMPDTHAGKGCTIGTTMTIKSKVCPNLVGVDIGCGMLTIELPFEELSLEKLDTFIHQQIPSGFNVNSKKVFDPYSENIELEQLRCFKFLNHPEMLYRSIGTLGGGNHFIEVDENEGRKYLVIHTGSRNLGKQVAEYYQNLAFDDCNQQKALRKEKQEEIIKQLKEENRMNEIESELKKLNEESVDLTKLPKDLCYLQGHHLEDYLHDMRICQEYARINRQVIGRRILEYLFYEQTNEQHKVQFKQNICTWKNIQFNYFETVHNYIDLDNMILRKGAISAQKDEIVLIPINMRDGAIIGKGKGNPDYNCSGPHGAGRLLSRSEAKQQVSLEDYKETMKHIYSTSVMESTLDESPFAYKPIEEIIENIQDSIEILQIIKPIYNYKAH